MDAKIFIRRVSSLTKSSILEINDRLLLGCHEVELSVSSTLYWRFVVPLFHVVLTQSGRPTTPSAMCCTRKVQTGKASHERLHLQEVYQDFRLLHFKIEAPSESRPHVIMDCASGSKRAAGLDKGVGEGTSVYPHQRVFPRTQQQPSKKLAPIPQCICFYTECMQSTPIYRVKHVCSDLHAH